MTFFPSLKNQFLNWDDDVHLLENTSIRYLDREHVKNIFQSNINTTYIPLTALSFAFEYQRCGFNPFVYHLDNLILHLLVVMLIFCFGRMVGLSTIGAAVAGLLFGVHPLHVESVAWVTERKDVLYSSFYMMALLFYWKYLKEQKIFFYLLSLIVGILSMLAKPMAVSLPLILLLCDWFYSRKWEKGVILEKIPYFVVLGILAWFTYKEHSRVPANIFGSGWLVWIWTFVFYIRQFIFPGILIPIYHLPRPITFFHLEYLFAFIIFVLFISSVIRWRRHKWFMFACLFYFLSIFFLLRFDDARDLNVVADRFMYLPSAGFCLWVGFLIEKLWGAPQKENGNSLKLLMILGFSLVIGVFSFRTFFQCQIWKDSLTLWRYQLLFHPNTAIALNNLAQTLEEQPGFQNVKQEYRSILELRKEGVSDQQLQYPRGIIAKIEYLQGLYKKAIELDPSDMDVYYNLARLYQDVGKTNEAVVLYNKILTLNPKYKDAYFNLGRLYQETNEVEKAIDAFTKDIQTSPDHPDLYINVLREITQSLKKDPNNPLYLQARDKFLEDFKNLAGVSSDSEVFYVKLGDVYQELKDFQRAKAAYEMALDINPQYVNALNNLGNSYVQLGEVKEGIFVFEKVLQIDPRDVHASLNLAAAYSQLGDYPQAMDFYNKAIAVNPNYADSYFQLGFVYEVLGKPQEAMKNYKKTIELDPNYAEAYYNLGNVYARLNLNKEAIASYQKTIHMNPNHVNAFVNLSILSFRMEDYPQAIKYGDEARVLGWDVPKEYLWQLEPYRKR